MQFSTRLKAALSVICLAVILASCASGVDNVQPANPGGLNDGRPVGGDVDRPVVDPNDPYARESERKIAKTESHFLKQVLEDHEITDAEFSEAQNRFEKCLNDAGIETSRYSISNAPSTITEVAVVGNGGDQPGFQTCTERWIDGIDMYSVIRYNPENVYWFELVTRCLVNNGVAPEGLTVAEVEGAASKVGVWHSEGKDYPPTDTNPVLPGGARWLDPMVRKCETDPLNPNSVELYEP